MPIRETFSRRTLLKSAAGSALLAGVGMPAIVRAQSDVVRIGHLTPLTGFLGPLGEYAQLGVKLAQDEVNAAGGVMGRKVELVMEDSVNPQTASAKAERLIERDKVTMIIGEISSASGLAIGQVANRLKTVFINTGCNSDALRGNSCNSYMFHIEGANSMYVMAA
ncbi:MAG TPA: ABC transporter substrate-binding protein, partial [Xanthobacteraceae bacterium]